MINHTCTICNVTAPTDCFKVNPEICDCCLYALEHQVYDLDELYEKIDDHPHLFLPNNTVVRVCAASAYFTQKHIESEAMGIRAYLQEIARDGVYAVVTEVDTCVDAVDLVFGANNVIDHVETIQEFAV